MPTLCEQDALTHNPMTTAPKDGTMLRLLVDYGENGGPSFEDTSDLCWTIGVNYLQYTGIDEWQMAGWSWCQDVFCNTTNNHGYTPIGWLPFEPEPEPEQPLAGWLGSNG